MNVMKDFTNEQKAQIQVSNNAIRSYVDSGIRDLATRNDNIEQTITDSQEAHQEKLN